MAKSLKLKRAVGLPLLVLYGLGNILGAGIYVLIGQVAIVSGYGIFLSFTLAFLVAALTAFSFMELSSRYPNNAGVPIYLHKAFNMPGLSTLVGLLMIGTGVVSAATLTKGLQGYAGVLLSIPEPAISIGAVSILCLIAVSGVANSAKLAAILTLVEISGLVLVVVAGLASSENPVSMIGEIYNHNWLNPGIVAGAFIAFYAFIGFEDMVELVEEVKNPRRTMPKAIFLSLLLATGLYILVAYSSLLVLTPLQLGNSAAPLAAVFTAATGSPASLLAGIGIASIAGGVLVQLVMGSRVLYGLASKGWIPSGFAQINRSSRTPVIGTLVITAAILLFTIFPIVRLAEITSFLILVVFTLVNLSLLVVKKRRGVSPRYHQVPRWVPMLGAVSSFVMLMSALWL